MKQRVISGLLWGLVAILTLVLMWSRLMEFLVSIFCTIAVYEILKVTGVKNIALKAVGLVVACAFPLISEYHVLEKYNVPIGPVFAIYVIVLLSLMLLFYEKTRFEHVAVTAFTSLAIPYAFSCFMLVRDIYKEFPDTFGKPQSVFLLLIGLSCSWMTDAFAYLIGFKFGKHKMSPKISPKKSYEGAAGGLVLTAVLNAIFLAVFNKFFFKSHLISYTLLIVLSFFLSVIGMLGDLSASAIKRNYGVKDFGKIMKGHGGVMDRFDSSVFVMPALYAIIVISQRI